MLQNNFQPNLENMKQYLEEEKSSSPESSSITWWSIPSGMSSIRILPPWDPSGRIALQVFMHPIEYQTPKMNYKKYNWTCVSKTFDKPCRICDSLQQMALAGVDTSKFEANRRQFYMNAIVMHDPRYQTNPKEGTAPGTHVLLRVPKTIYDWVISQITNPMVGDITSLTNGIDVYITKEGKGLDTSYSATLSPNGRTPVPQEYLSKIDSLYNLDEIFSTGFDDETINSLIASLNGSTDSMNKSIPSAVNQMAGYQNTPVVPVSGIPASNPPSVAPIPPVPSAGMPTGGNVPPIAPSPYSNSSSPASLEAPPVSQGTIDMKPAADSPAGNAPRCYGQYTPSQVACVVCPFEIQCSKDSVK